MKCSRSQCNILYTIMRFKQRPKCFWNQGGLHPAKIKKIYIGFHDDLLGCFESMTVIFLSAGWAFASRTFTWINEVSHCRGTPGWAKLGLCVYCVSVCVYCLCSATNWAASDWVFLCVFGARRANEGGAGQLNASAEEEGSRTDRCFITFSHSLCLHPLLPSLLPFSLPFPFLWDI